MFSNLKQKLNVSSDITNVHRSESPSIRPHSKNSKDVQSTESSTYIEDSSSVNSRTSISKQVLSNLLVEKSHEIDSLHSKVKEMNDMLQECADTIELLNGEKEQFQLKLNLASSELNAKFEVLKKENLDLTLVNTKLRNECSKLTSEKDLLQSQCNEGSDHNECLLRQMESERKMTLLEESLERLQETQITIESERCSLVTELDLEVDKRDSLQKDKEVIEDECRKLLEQCKNKDSKIEELNLVISATSDELKEVSKSNELLLKRLEELKISHFDKHNECTSLEKQLQVNKDEDNRSLEKEQIVKLQKICDSLNDEISSKNQIIKKEQLKLKDLKKVMQKELNIQTNQDGKAIENNIPKINERLEPLCNEPKVVANTFSNISNNSNDSLLNMEYLRHVILKFLISTEGESLQLVKALTTLLKFSKEEEAMLSNSLQWRQSWFGGTRPKLSNARINH